MNYIVRKDGDSWFASTEDFVNIQESVASFGETPTEALRNFMGVDTDGQIDSILHGQFYDPSSKPFINAKTELKEAL